MSGCVANREAPLKPADSRLPEHLEGYSRLDELREQLHKEAPNRLGATQQALRGEELRLGSVVRHGADNVAIAKAVEVMREYVLGRRGDSVFLFQIHDFITE